MAKKKGYKRPKTYTINGKKVTPGATLQRAIDAHMRRRPKTGKG